MFKDLSEKAEDSYAKVRNSDEIFEMTEEEVK